MRIYYKASYKFCRKYLRISRTNYSSGSEITTIQPILNPSYGCRVIVEDHTASQPIRRSLYLSLILLGINGSDGL
jgi:hypothetical protein